MLFTAADLYTLWLQNTGMLPLRKANFETRPKSRFQSFLFQSLAGMASVAAVIAPVGLLVMLFRLSDGFTTVREFTQVYPVLRIREE